MVHLLMCILNFTGGKHEITFYILECFQLIQYFCLQDVNELSFKVKLQY